MSDRGCRVPMQARAKPLHWRLTPAIASLTAVALLVAGVGLLFYSERSFRTQKIDEVGVEARILASTVAAALNFTDRDAAQEYVDALKANPEVQEAAVYDKPAPCSRATRRREIIRCPRARRLDRR